MIRQIHNNLPNLQYENTNLNLHPYNSGINNRNPNILNKKSILDSSKDQLSDNSQQNQLKNWNLKHKSDNLPTSSNHFKCNKDNEKNNV